MIDRKESGGSTLNEKEIAEIRRRYRQDKNNITHIRGCYVNEEGEILSDFDQSLGLMAQEESDKFLAVLKRTLSGTLGKNLLNIEFETQQVVSGEEHQLLMRLRDSALKDEEAVQTFFQRVTQNLTMEGNYLILLAHDTYDVFFRSKDGERQDDASSMVYSYILCSICPIKMTKPALRYCVPENEFSSCTIDRLVSAPELGFVFPAFDDRMANLYGALYYTKNVADSREQLIDALFKAHPPMPAEEQKETFQEVLGEALGEECSYQVVESVRDQLCGMIQEHKESKVEEPLAISKGQVREVLQNCGVSESGMTVFEEKFDEEFGADTELSPRNLVDLKQIQLKTPNVRIQVDPECGDLVETRVIDGVKYILIRAEEGVEVNGVSVKIP